MRNLLPSKVLQVLERTSIFVFAISGIILYLIGLSAYMQWTRHDAQSADPVLSGIRGITDEISQAHVLYMEFAASNKSGELKDAAAHLQKALALAEELPPRKNKFYKLTGGPETGAKLDEHLENIENITYSLREIVDLTIKGIYAVNFDGDELFDKLHGKALNHAHNSAEIIRQMVQRHLWDQQKTFFSLMVLGIAGLFFTGITFYCNDKKCRDIKERLVRSKEKAEKEKAEEATKLKDKFVAMVAHDIRAPFSTIMGFLQLIQDDATHPLCSRHKDIVTRCIGVGEDLIRLTENLLNINRLNTGKIAIQARFIDAAFVVNHVIHLLEPLARKKGIRLLNTIPKHTRIFADMELYHQVIANLASNAIKFSRTGDTITLFIPRENPSGIAVKDTGVGIPREHHPRLFEITQNRSTLGTNREKGTGLGLPYCRDIMLAHDGSLEFESTVGEGSIFYTRLPARRPLVMVVDDDHLIRFGVREWLELWEMEVIDASNGRQALKMIENSVPNIIISDIYMPDMDGIDFISQISKMAPYREIPFIFITAQPDVKAEILKRITYFNDNDFISKPFGKDDLIEKIKKYVGYPLQHGCSINQQI